MLASVLADEHADVLQSRADIPGVVDEFVIAVARGLMKGEHRFVAGTRTITCPSAFDSR